MTSIRKEELDQLVAKGDVEGLALMVVLLKGVVAKQEEIIASQNRSIAIQGKLIRRLEERGT